MIPPPRVCELAGGTPVLHYGPASGPQLLVLQPLFEEMNRCRALVAALCRNLAARGFGCWLPDLPGCGESMTVLERVSWADWTAAVDSTLAMIMHETGAAAAAVALRGGALLDGTAARRWRLSPVAGTSLLTDLRRAGLLASGIYALGEALAGPMAGAEPMGGARVVRLADDERACDRLVAGPSLWRRPEPLAAPELAAILAADVAEWMRA